jgi:hypothetical protein
MNQRFVRACAGLAPDAFRLSSSASTCDFPPQSALALCAYYLSRYVEIDDAPNGGAGLI